MHDLRVGLAQIAPRLGDVAANLELHREAIESARKERCDLVVFPELSLTGYLLRDLTPDVALPLGHPTLTKLAEASRDVDLVVGFVEDGPGHRFHNCAAYFSRGALTHLHRKLFLPTYGLFLEGREFAAGDRVRAFDTPAGPAGMLVCEDLWHQTCAWLLAQDGAEILYGISAGPTRGARPDEGVTSVGVWRQLLQTTAQFLTSWVVFVNRVGCEDGLVYGGGSMVVDPFGRVTAALDPIAEGLLPVQLEADVLRRARISYPLLRDSRLDVVRRELERLQSAEPGREADAGNGSPAKPVAETADAAAGREGEPSS